ncbi:MAG TPA: ABC transporter permease subunit [Thermodesulfobacteriota bacterium]
MPRRGGGGRPWGHAGWPLWLPAAALAAIGFAAPLAWLGRLSLYESAGSGGYGLGNAGLYVAGTLTLDNYRALLADRYVWRIAAFTLELGLVSALASVALAYPFALVIDRARGWSQAALLGATILPKFVNPLVVIAGVEVALAQDGPVRSLLVPLGLVGEETRLAHTFLAVVVGEVVFVLPYAVLILVATFASVGRSLVAAARGLGASPLRAFLEVTLPLSWRGTRAALVLCLVFGLSAFTAPFFLGGPEHYTLSILVHRLVLVNLDWAAGAAAAVEMLGLAVLVVLVASRLAAAPRTGDREATVPAPAQRSAA